MRFKIDDNLKEAAAAIQLSPIDLSIFARLLCQKLIASNILSDVPDNYGLTMIQATGRARVYDVVFALIEYLGIPALDMDTFDAFCRCVVIGDGDCPECGGELEHIENEGHEIKDGDYLTPNTYVVDKYVYRCRECGETIKLDQEL
jgi:hypothetical protein